MSYVPCFSRGGRLSLVFIILLVLLYKFSPYGVYEHNYVRTLEDKEKTLEDLRQRNELLLKYNFLETKSKLKYFENERIKYNKKIDSLSFTDK